MSAEEEARWNKLRYLLISRQYSGGIFNAILCLHVATIVKVGSFTSTNQHRYGFIILVDTGKKKRTSDQLKQIKRSYNISAVAACHCPMQLYVFVLHLMFSTVYAPLTTSTDTVYKRDMLQKKKTARTD